MTLRLVVFDVDGTLVDSQALILGAMAAAFDAVGAPLPPRAQVLGIVGLSLPVAMARLAPDADGAALVAAYRDAFFRMRLRDTAPLYPGALNTLDALARDPAVLLGIATGKSRRGLEALLDAHGLAGRFVTVQTADDHPSKPHPSMLARAMADTGVEPAQAVMVGDTSFDMDMARAAGMAAIGVGWGYHPAADLHAAGAAAVIDRFDALAGALGTLWEAA